jgi:EAL domain-containing protein (putative c-di-GMP-specific phosphodiesterase class I)
MSARMREIIAPPHVPARVGGDEFVVVIDSLPLEAARALCERLRVALSDRAYHYQDKAFSVTASIGLIRVLEGMRAPDALTASDRACAEAKRLGGGSVISFDSSSGELMDYLEEIKLVAGMKERLPVENFFTQLQPIVSLRNPRSSLCYEVLIRMRDASGAVMPPSRFIPAAERNGLMTQIDRWVLRSTLEWLDSQPVHRNDIDFCTINLSGASLNDEKFLQDTIALIRDHPHSTRKICFEITESVALYDLNTTRRFVDTVKSFGAMVALDDFGAGYTSFSYLKELPADLVKIDGNFIRDVNSNPANFAITRAVVELAHELGMGCVAEWAENAEIVRSLIQLRIDYAQGYGLCRPIERERILAVSNSAALIADLATADLVFGRGTTSVESVWGAALPI